MVVLSVNMYSAGSNGSLSGNPTRAVSGIGGSRHGPADMVISLSFWIR